MGFLPTQRLYQRMGVPRERARGRCINLHNSASKGTQVTSATFYFFPSGPFRLKGSGVVFSCVFWGKSVKGLVDTVKSPQVSWDMRSDATTSDLFFFPRVACNSLPCTRFPGKANSQSVKQMEQPASSQKGGARCHLECCLSSLCWGNSGQGGALRASWCVQRSAVQGGVHRKHSLVHSFIHPQIFLEQFPSTVLSTEAVEQGD